jgi:hypothetical protein
MWHVVLHPGRFETARAESTRNVDNRQDTETGEERARLADPLQITSSFLPTPNWMSCAQPFEIETN